MNVNGFGQPQTVMLQMDNTAAGNSTYKKLVGSYLKGL